MIYTDFTHGVLSGVSTYTVTSPYGMRTIFGVRSMHNGIDLKPVAKVMAFEKGRVTTVSFSSISGNYVTLQHDGATTTYRHLANGSIPVSVGQVLPKGAIIGTVGATGMVTGAHLHFDIKINGVWTDPLPYLQGKQTIKPYKESYTMNRPQLPMLKVLVPNLYYRDKPNGVRVAYLDEKSYAYLGKTALINGYEWAQIILKDDEIVWVGLSPTLNQIVPIEPVVKIVEKLVPVIQPFNASITKDGMVLTVSLAPGTK